MSDPEPSAESLVAAASQLVDATRLAWSWHGLQTRKGRSTSYMSHLLQVQGMVVAAGGRAPEAIAALLHDALEDAPDPTERAERERVIRSRFDDAVLQIVLDCTDTTPAEAGNQKGPWRERKERYLEQLRDAGGASRLVAACDKRHNLGDLVADLRHEGPATLARFNAGAAEQVWYYESLAAVCRDAIPERLSLEIEDLARELRRLLEITDDA